MIGRLKRSLKERCPVCGRVLQVREISEKSIKNGIPVAISKEYIRCSNPSCDYERNIEQKRIREKETFEF